MDIWVIGSMIGSRFFLASRPNLHRTTRVWLWVPTRAIREQRTRSTRHGRTQKRALKSGYKGMRISGIPPNPVASSSRGWPVSILLPNGPPRA